MQARFSVRQKYRICQVVVGLGFVMAVYWMMKMRSYETPHHNKVMFGLAMMAIVIAVPFGLGFYYYRAKLRDVDTGAVQIAALAHVGQKPQPPADSTKTEKS